MGAWCSGHSWRYDTFADDSVALYSLMGIETIPNETTPFHIDRGMATQFTSWMPGWLLSVGHSLSPRGEAAPLSVIVLAVRGAGGRGEGRSSSCPDVAPL